MNEWEKFLSSVRSTTVHANGMTFDVAEAGEGPRLALCLHGFPECNFSWRHQIPTLVSRGYRVWAPNLRGYGGSDKPRGIASYAMPELMNDVAGLIDASGSDSTLLLAHDWGAVIAWAFAIHKVRPLAGLVIMNVPHPACFYAQLRTYAQLRRSWYMLFFQIPWLPEALLGANDAYLIGRLIRASCRDRSRFGDEILRVYRQNACRPGSLTAMLNYYRGLLRSRAWRDLERLPVIETQTLMLWGEEDAALGIACTENTERYVRDLTLHLLSGVSHWVQQEAPEQVNQMLENWLDRGLREDTDPASVPTHK